jgi:hypothetical protein
MNGFSAEQNNIAFNIEVFPEVFWVPINILGKSNFSENEIENILLLTPDEKKQKSKFKYIIDNIRILESETSILWELSKPGYHSVRTNMGCCTSDTNWLVYLLNGTYKTIGSFNYTYFDGGGHITSYIKHEGWYYFFDMTSQNTDNLPLAGEDNGDIDDYRSHYFNCYLHRTKNIRSYCDYMDSLLTSKPLFYYITEGDNKGIGKKYKWQKNDDIFSIEIDDIYRHHIYNNLATVFIADNSLYELHDSVGVEPNWSMLNLFDFRTL